MSDDTTTELESVQELLDKDEQARARAARKAPRGFDPACAFLLKMNPINLFDPAGPGGLRFRCKGCGDVVSPTKRQKHHAQHVRAFAKSGGRTYPDTPIATTPEEETQMASTTPTKRSGTRSSSRSLGSSSRAATKSGSAKVAAAKKTGTAAKATTAKTGTATKSGTAKQRADAGKLVAAAAAELKGKSPMTASALADAVCKKDSKLKPFNVAFAIRAAARKGETFKRSNDRPALYSLKG